MKAKLIIVAGPITSATFDLTEDEISIGREVTSHVRLADPSVSRRHSLIRKETEHFKIIDLDSFNGTYVNGALVMEQSLKQGDQIAIGDVMLLFLLLDVEKETAQPAVQLDDASFLTQSTLQLKKQD
jgi:pSer/pThr/pTyr-binding forkhead associated (FHA) protein